MKVVLFCGGLGTRIREYSVVAAGQKDRTGVLGYA